METNTNQEPSEPAQATAYAKNTLSVKASELFTAIYPATDAVVDEFTSIENSKGHKKGYKEAKKNFLTDVHLNDSVSWTIKKDNVDQQAGDYKLDLISIDQKLVADNANIFNYDMLVPKNGKIEAEVTRGSLNDEYIYRIIFTITNKNGDVQAYAVDPKLRIQNT